MKINVWTCGKCGNKTYEGEGWYCKCPKCGEYFGLTSNGKAWMIAFAIGGITALLVLARAVP